jgi:GNAT superfamily N-acetyltransferase
MKKYIKTLLREGLVKEQIKSTNINDIDDDYLFNKLVDQSRSLAQENGISFGQAELFDVLLNDEELIGATWVDTAGNFSFHIAIKPEYRSKGLSKVLLNSLFNKYNKMKSYRGEDYKIRVNVVNDSLAKSLAKYHGLKVIEDNGTQGVIMGN